MTRLLRDGFGVGALPPALVSQELERGELTLLRLGPPPPNLPVVVSGAAAPAWNWWTKWWS